jgi:hypothetical protein
MHYVWRTRRMAFVVIGRPAATQSLQTLTHGAEPANGTETPSSDMPLSKPETQHQQDETEP